MDKIKLWSVVLPSFVKLARITELQGNDKISHYDNFCVKQHNLYMVDPSIQAMLQL